MSRSPSIVYCDGESVPEQVIDSGGEHRILDRQDYLEGYAAGQRECIDRFGPLLDRLESELTSIEGFRQELVVKLEENIVDLSLAVSRKLLHQEIEEGRYKASLMVQGLLRALGVTDDSVGLQLRLHPEDYQEVLKSKQEGSGAFPELAHVALIPDETVLPASFSIDSDLGHVICDVENQLGELEGFLREGES